MEKILSPENFKNKKIHFIGIGGIGMSALARYFHAKGSQISGSDKNLTSTIYDLKNEGIINIWIPHKLENIKKINPDFIVYSTAINLNDNDEFIWAKECGKKILHRSDLLTFATNSKKTISISGTHGKTTTTAMVCEILSNNNFDPSCIIGGILVSKNTNTIIGNGEYFLIEADESDKSFLKGNPEIVVITNIEEDHLENYPGGIEEIKKSFIEFANNGLTKKGLIFCIQDKYTKEIISKNFNLSNPKLISYGINDDNVLLFAKHNLSKGFWDIYFKGKLLNTLKLKNPGEHSILNALAAYGVGLTLGINADKIKESLESYQGVKRRFEFLINTKELTIIDDYAHHPTEIKAAIKAARELLKERLIIVLQPHQPTRVKDLWKDFVSVLKQEEDLIFITDIYVARGPEIESISSKRLVQEINKTNVNYLPGKIEKIAKFISNVIKQGDLILILGAGDITTVGPELIKEKESLALQTGNN